MYKAFRTALDLACYAGSGAFFGVPLGIIWKIGKNNKLRYITNPCSFIFVLAFSHKMAEIASDDICGLADTLHDAWEKSKEEPETEEE